MADLSEGAAPEKMSKKEIIASLREELRKAKDDLVAGLRELKNVKTNSNDDRVRLDTAVKEVATATAALAKAQKKAADRKTKVQKYKNKIVNLEKELQTATTSAARDKAKAARLKTRLDNLAKKTDRAESKAETKKAEKIKVKLLPTTQRFHSNHDGKAVPYESYGKQKARLLSLSASRDFIQIQRGTFLGLFEDVEVRGYFEEIGSNILTEDDVEVPGILVDLAEKCAKAIIDTEVANGSTLGVTAETSERSRRATEFGQYVLCLTYAAWNQLQGPFYNNGCRPYLRPDWKQDHVTAADLIADQGPLIGAFVATGLERFQLSGLKQDPFKALLAEVLGTILTYHRKYASKVRASSGHNGQLTGKLRLPKTDEYAVSAEVAAAEARLPRLPPTFDGREIRGDRDIYGQRAAANKRKRSVPKKSYDEDGNRLGSAPKNIGDPTFLLPKNKKKRKRSNAPEDEDDLLAVKQSVDKSFDAASSKKRKAEKSSSGETAAPVAEEEKEDEENDRHSRTPPTPAEPSPTEEAAQNAINPNRDTTTMLAKLLALKKRQQQQQQK